MRRKKRILIIAHFCDYGQEQTNNRFNYLAELLTDHGFNVELITSSFSHRDKRQRDRTNEADIQYKTTLLYEPSYQRNISLKRLFISHPAFAKNLKRYLESCEKPDLIYCAIPSVDAAEKAAQHAQKQGIPFVLDVQDLWPEAYKLILKSDALYNMVTMPMQKRVDRVYAAGDQIVAVSHTYACRASSVNKKCKHPLVVYIGTDTVAFERNAKENTPPHIKPNDEFWVGYCGTLGHSYDLKTAMEAIKILHCRGRNNVRLMVIGSGPLENQFRAEASALGILSAFTGKLPYGQMCAQLAQCDIAVNPIAAGAAQSIINKHADYAVAGLAVINTQENEEYKNLLAEYMCGINCQPGNAEQVARAIGSLIENKELLQAMSKNAGKLGKEKFERTVSYRKIVETIQTMTSARDI